MSNSSQQPTGLHGKRKKELVAIANDMGLSLLPSAGKFDLEEAIRDALRASRSLRTNPLYSAIWDSMPDSQDDSSQADSDSESESEEEDATPAYRPTRSTGTPRRSSSINKVAHKAASKVATAEKSALALASPRRLTRSTSQLGLIVRKSSTNLREAAIVAKDETVNAVAATQELLSTSWTLTSVLVGAEIAYLAWAAVPWKQITYGPQKWLIRSPTPAFSFKIPDLSILIHPTFTSSFVRWSILTILLPLIASLFLAFPGPRTRRSSARRTIAPPNALSFGLARLAITILAGYIFSHPSKTQWSFDSVEGYPALSVLGSALSAAFAALDN